ncbi:hypothetical protein [Paraherbaspirillum soli]|uniref:Uncharacterized protein n=1 Tax=Paraherbaspirillum soli TaxID=631222 RepID=A0ABW0MFK3_9BURK
MAVMTKAAQLFQFQLIVKPVNDLSSDFMPGGLFTLEIKHL